MDERQQSQSVVEMCGVTNCTYNQARQCTAGSISVELVDNMPHCTTFSPRDGSVGIGSTSVDQRTSEKRDQA